MQSVPAPKTPCVHLAQTLGSCKVLHMHAESKHQIWLSENLVSPLLLLVLKVVIDKFLHSMGGHATCLTWSSTMC